VQPIITNPGTHAPQHCLVLCQAETKLDVSASATRCRVQPAGDITAIPSYVDNILTLTLAACRKLLNSTYVDYSAVPREIEKFITRQPPRWGKQDYDSENSCISEYQANLSSLRRKINMIAKQLCPHFLSGIVLLRRYVFNKQCHKTSSAHSMVLSTKHNVNVKTFQ